MSFVKKNIKWFGLGICVFIIIAEFLPFISATALGIEVSSGSIISSSTGIIILVATLISAALIFFDKAWFSLITSIISFLIVLLNLSGDGINVTLEIGAYLLIIGHICEIAYPVVRKILK